MKEVAKESAKNAELYSTATAIMRGILNETDLTISDIKVNNKDFEAIERKTVQMIFIVLCAQIEQIMLDLYSELIVYEGTLEVGLSEKNQKIARKTSNRGNNNVSRPEILDQVKSKLSELFKFQPSASDWNYISASYTRRDTYLHGRRNVKDSKKDLRLRDGVIGKLSNTMKSIANAVDRKI